MFQRNNCFPSFYKVWEDKIVTKKGHNFIVGMRLVCQVLFLQNLYGVARKVGILRAELCVCVSGGKFQEQSGANPTKLITL